MSDTAVGGPLAVDLISLGNNWVPLDSNSNPTGTRVNQPGADGDEIATKLIDGKSEITQNFVCKEETGNLTIPSAGLVYNGYLLTQIRLTYDRQGWPKLAVTCHNHDDAAHAADVLPYFVCSLIFPAQFGIPAMGTLGAVAGAASLEYELSCEHVDELDGVGDHLCGTNYNGQEKITLGFTGTPTTPLTDSTGWALVSAPDGASNTAFDTKSYSYEKKITRTNPE